MTTHSYSLRSRFNSPLSVKSSANSPIAKTPSRSPRKAQQPPVALHLDHVIGTTTSSPGGLSCCTATNAYAYCGGSVAVLVAIGEGGYTSRRYYKARPTASAVNPASAYYDPPTTPTKRRTLLPGRRESVNFAIAAAESNDDTNKTWSARERIKAVTCVSLSPDGRLLAVGETGYNPRVLLFSTASDAPVDIPLSIMTEHTWGVKCVAFSPDSRWLATLGDVNDGFLFLWSVNTKAGSVRLVAANKCTTNVCHMAWCGKALITVGTRHIKIWQIPGNENATPSKRSRLRSLVESVPSPGLLPMLGRNCLLGTLVDATFTCIAPLSEEKAVVCSDFGQICMIDTSKTPTVLSPIDVTQDFVRAVCVGSHPERLIWAGGGGELRSTALQDILTISLPDGLPQDESSEDRGRKHSRCSGLRQSLGISQLSQAGIVALGSLMGCTISIDANSSLRVHAENQEQGTMNVTESSSHNESVGGVQHLPSDAALGAFFTWSRRGEVKIWNSDSELRQTAQVDLEEVSEDAESYSNELRLVRYLGNKRFAFGDRFGMIKCLDLEKSQCYQTLRAHAAEVTDIATHLPSSVLVSSSRDRMIQIFCLRNGFLDLIQTSDDHIAAVSQVLFSHDGEKLLSCSADRTIVVREKARRDRGDDMVTAFLQTRVITVKANPLSMCLAPKNEDVILVSTLDRHVSRIDFATGTLVNSFKVSDPDSDDTAVLNTIHPIQLDNEGGSETVLVGYSSTDKSVRIYDLEKGIMFGRESAHTEGISDLAVLPSPDDTGKFSVVSTGQDSTIMLWTVSLISKPLPTPLSELSQELASLSYESDATPVKASPASLPPLRKILTKVDVAEFQLGTPPRSPLRDPSPARLRRKNSRLALATSAIEEADENVTPEPQRKASGDDRARPEQRSPSPPRNSLIRSKKQRSRSEMGRDSQRQNDWTRRSPSPPPTSNSNNQKNDQRANKARLRRPPSVPTDLRGHALAQQTRRQSTSSTNDFGSMNMATEQACRMLKTYKKRLQTSKGELDLDEIEDELEAVLKAVRYRKDAVNRGGFSSKRPASTIVTDGNMLARLLEKTSLKG